MILIMALTLLITGFFVHVLWWRLWMPRNATITLLTIFMATLICGIFLTSANLWQTVQIVQLILLYVSCFLVYIILYSAVEQQSPTLAIVAYINQCGGAGCSEDLLRQQLCLDVEINKRLHAISQSGWIISDSDKLKLSSRGRYVACLFQYAAKLFGLRAGG